MVMKKVKRKKRVLTEEQKQKKRERNRKYRARPEVKAKAKKRQAKYRARPEVKAKMKKYRARPEVKAKMKKYFAKHHATSEYKAQQRQLMRKRRADPNLGPKMREQRRKYKASKQPLCCICLTVRTGAGACKECFAKVQGGGDVSIEAFVRCALEHKFPGTEFCTKTRLGGLDCTQSIDGSLCPAGSAEALVRTKAALPDLAMVLLHMNIYIEIDENRHQYYEESCELARYDTVQFGADSIKPSLCLRFNPHVVVNQDLPSLEDRIKFLMQRLRNAINAPIDKEAEPIMTVQHLFYGSGSTQLKTAQRAANSLIILDEVNDATSIDYDDDIMMFSLDDLNTKSLDFEANKATMERVAANVSGERCMAMNCAFNTKKRRRCSCSPAKGKTLCPRHLRMELAQKKVVLYTDTFKETMEKTSMNKRAKHSSA